MKDPNRFYLYLAWPKYLAQWYAHEMYRLQHIEDDYEEPYQYNCDVEVRELEPVKTMRGSAERGIIEMSLAKQPTAIPEPPDRNATICIEIPSFLGKPAEVYNYLKPSARQLLETSVRNRLRMELIKYMNKTLFGFMVSRKGGLVQREQVLMTFMEDNGIEDTEANLFALKKVWNRLYNKIYYKRKNENTGS